jgi:glycerol-3-phosphate dehydrogenase
VENCNARGIPTREITPEQARAIEPALNPALKLAVQVPDATMDAWRLPLQFLATAKANGADIRPFSEVIGIHQKSSIVTGVQIFDHKTLKTYDLQGDIVVNATGSWSGKTSAMADVNVQIQPAPGVMVALNARLTSMVINRLQTAGQGDIVVPQRGFSIVGTSFWLADDPDVIEFPRDHIQKMLSQSAELVPAVQHTPIHCAWLAVRPLLGNTDAEHAQLSSRTFDCYDHKQRDNIEGLVSIIGGKATTMRAMAEETADLICRKTGRDIPCRTRETKLLHYRMFYKNT